MSEAEIETAVATIEAIAAAHPERYVPVAARVLRSIIDGRDAQEARVMQVSASANEWWGLYDQELRRADDLAARLAAVEALADRWDGVLTECKQADPRWILDRSVMGLETARNELRAALHSDPSERA